MWKSHQRAVGHQLPLGKKEPFLYIEALNSFKLHAATSGETPSRFQISALYSLIQHHKPQAIQHKDGILMKFATSKVYSAEGTHPHMSHSHSHLETPLKQPSYGRGFHVARSIGADTHQTR